SPAASPGHDGAPRPCPWRAERTGWRAAARAWGAPFRVLFPVLDLELRLELLLPVVDLQLEVLGADTLLEAERSAALVVTAVPSLAVEERDQLVQSHLEIAEIQPLHAALEQRIALALSVEVVDDFLLVDLQLHGVEREERADVHGEEHCHLRVGGKQQLLLQH